MDAKWVELMTEWRKAVMTLERRVETIEKSLVASQANQEHIRQIAIEQREALLSGQYHAEATRTALKALLDVLAGDEIL